MTANATPANELLRPLLGSRVDSLTSEEEKMLAETATDGCKFAVLAEVGTDQEASAAAAFFERMKRRALARVADETRGGAPATYVHGDWLAVLAVIDDRKAELRALPNVVGFGPGYRRRDTITGGEHCLVLYVRRKLNPDQLRDRGSAALPTSMSADDGTTVPTDVVEFGSLRRQVGAGGAVGPVRSKSYGTVGAFAEDLVFRSRVAVTAMHVTGLDEPCDPPLQLMSPPWGQDGAAVFGTLLRGTRMQTDAASIAIPDGASVTNQLPGIGMIAGWRPIDLTVDYNAPVQLYGATSGFRRGVIVEPMIHLPQYDLESALLVDIDTRDGDSGAALLDASNLLIGFLVGRARVLDGLRVFTPASLVFTLLSCELIP